jgi:23S rRNA pseudouridine1911/1915/1917 synthase
MSLNTLIVTIDAKNSGLRLDKTLAVALPELSRSRLQSLIENGHVTCNGKRTEDASAKVKTGQEYRIDIPEAAPSYLAPQKIDLDIVYEDDDLLVLNKQAGLTVHPGAGNPDMTLVNALLAHCGETLSGIGGVARPGLVHRIDKDTTGLLVVAKNDVAHVHLSEQLATRTLKRTYTALVWGTPKLKSGTITGNIGRSISNRQKMTVVKTGGKPAVTHYKVITSYQLPIASLVECNLETGRTHQIRVHMTHIGCPLVGDPVYGSSTSQRLKAGAYKNLPETSRQALLNFTRQALHAKALTLVHPRIGKSMDFECELPQDMQTLIKALC